MAVILAQARSLNFDITVGSQDVNSMKRLGGIIEKEVQAIIANCNTKIGLKNEDPEATYDLFARSGGRALEIGRASCRERVLSVRVDTGGRRIIKKKKKEKKQEK